MLEDSRHQCLPLKESPKRTPANFLQIIARLLFNINQQESHKNKKYFVMQKFTNKHEVKLSLFAI